MKKKEKLGVDKEERSEEVNKPEQAPLFCSNDAFLLVVYETMTPPYTHTTHTSQTQPPNTLQPLLSAIVPIPVSPDLLHTPLHMDKWLGLAWPD